MFGIKIYFLFLFIYLISQRMYTNILKTYVYTKKRFVYKTPKVRQTPEIQICLKQKSSNV